MRPAISRIFLILVLSALTVRIAMAAPSVCTALEDSGPQWFAAQLQKAQATHRSGNSAVAYRQLFDATMQLPRRVDVSLDARCVGPSLWQQYYLLRQTITQALGHTAEQAGRLAGSQGALDLFVTGDNRDDARPVIRQLTPTPEGTAWVISRLRSEIAKLERAVSDGFDLLPAEAAARTFWQRGLDGTVPYAQAKMAEALKAEAGLQTRAATANELELEQAQRDSKTMATAVFGDQSLTPVNEAQREVNRANASLILLQAALDWGLAVSESDARPVKERATERGDAMLAKANEPALGAETRDHLYQAAEDYFKFSGNLQRLQAAERDREAFAPVLKAALDQRAAKLDKHAEQLRESSITMKKNMEKTAAEKQSFKAEADAMEDELGF
jgi:hypothetical protein